MGYIGFLFQIYVSFVYLFGKHDIDKVRQTSYEEHEKAFNYFYNLDYVNSKLLYLDSPNYKPKQYFFF